MTSKRFFVHYDQTTGELRGSVDSNTAPRAFPGCAVLEVDESHLGRDHRDYRVENGVLVHKARPQRVAHRLPQASDLKTAIKRELAETDFTQLPDAPFDAAAKQAWRAYRAALRALTGAPLDMIAAWPQRPDGLDAIGHLRAKIDAAHAVA